MTRILLSLFVLVITFTEITSQNHPVLATLEKDVETRIISTAGSSIVFRCGLKIYLSDGTVNGTKIIGELQDDQKVKHAEVLIADKLYFIIGKLAGASDDVETLVEVDPSAGTMRNLVTSQDEITGLVSYRQRLYFALKDHPIHGHAYLSYKPESDQFTHMFDTEGYGVQDAVIHSGLIYLILQSSRWDGVSLAYSNGGVGVLEEVYNLDKNEVYGWDVNINMTSAEQNLFFWFKGDNSWHTFYVSDGTESGTMALKEDFKRSHWENFDTDRLDDIEVIGDRIFFRGEESISFEPHLWTSDGTVAGTKELLLNNKNIFEPHNFTVLNEQLYLGVRGDESAVVDIQSLTVESAFNIDETGNEVQDSGHDMVNHNGTLFLSAWIKDTRQFELFTKRPQNKSIQKVSDLDALLNFVIGHFTSAGPHLFFFILGNETPELRIYNPQLSSTTNITSQPLEIYPNPSQSHIYLENASDYNEVMIMDLSGKMIRRITQFLENEILISDLPSGLYHLIASNSSASYSTSFFKN